MIIGPAFNFLLLNINIRMDPFKLDNLSAPGVRSFYKLNVFISFEKISSLKLENYYYTKYINDFTEYIVNLFQFFKLLMAILWTILQILVIFFYKNLHEFNQSPLAIRNDTQQEPYYDSIARIDERNESLSNQKDREINSKEESEKTSLLGSRSIRKENKNLSSSTSYDTIRIVDNSETGPLVIRLYNEYIRHEVVAVYSSTFTVFFMQTALEV